MSGPELCGTCLARGRHLAPLGAARAAHITRDAELNTARVQELGARLRVCWECRALVGKSLLFCERVRRAQRTLAATSDQKRLSSISTLCCTVKLGFDYQFTSLETNPATNEASTGEGGTAFEAVFVSPIKEELEPEEVAEEPEEVTEEPDEVTEELEEVTEEPDEVYEDPENFIDIAEVKLESNGLVVVTEIKQATGKCELTPTVQRRADEVPIPTSPSISVQKKTDTAKKKSCIREVDMAAVKGTLATGNKVRLLVMDESEMKSVREKERTSERYTKSLFKCETCILGFLSSSLLEEHKEKMHKPEMGPHRCDICETRFTQDILLSVHRTAHYKRHVCMGCGFMHRTYSSVQRHYVDVHVTDRKFRCSKCNEVFSQFKYLRTHRRVHNAKLSAKKATRCFEDGSGARFQCSLCPKSYRLKSSLRTHVITHQAPAITLEPSPDTYCVKCDRYFRNKSNLKSHLHNSPKHVSRDTYRHACDECSKLYHCASLLREHKKSVHLKIRSHACDACDKTYYSGSALTSHIKRCHAGGERTREHTCARCGSSFFERSQLKTHSRIHTKERPYACLLCSATFRFNAALYTHNKLKHKMTTAQIRKKLGKKTI